MRIVILGIVISVLLLASCTSTHRTLSYKAMRKDLNRLERAIRLTHPAMDRTISDESLTSLRDDIESRIPTVASVVEFAALVNPLIDTLQGGHIGIYPRGAMWRYRFPRIGQTLPLSLKQLDNGQTVISSLRYGQDSVLLGAQVVEINGRPIDELVDEANLFSGGSDGPNRSGARNRAVTNLPKHLRWTLGKQDSFLVKVRIEGQDSTLTLHSPASTTTEKPETKTDRRQRVKRRELPINYGFDESRNVAIIDINSFSGYDVLNIGFPMVLGQVLAKAERDSAQTIILDLRDNGGGRAANVNRVLRYFVQEKTAVYGDWTLPKSGWLYANPFYKIVFTPSLILDKGKHARFGRTMHNNIKPNSKTFDGKLIVLINSGTFSAASITAAVLKSSGRAVLMGQEAGGNYHETYAGLFTMIGLRRTGLMVRMPHLLIPVNVDESKQPFGKTLQPDIKIPVTIEDILDPRDRVLLQALEYSNN